MSSESQPAPNPFDELGSIDFTADSPADAESTGNPFDLHPGLRGMCKVVDRMRDEAERLQLLIEQEMVERERLRKENHRFGVLIQAEWHKTEKARAEATDLRSALVGLIRAVDGVARGEWGIDDIKADRAAAARALTGDGDG